MKPFHDYPYNINYIIIDAEAKSENIFSVQGLLVERFFCLLKLVDPCTDVFMC